VPHSARARASVADGTSAVSALLSRGHRGQPVEASSAHELDLVEADNPYSTNGHCRPEEHSKPRRA
jgi:hypothetical protein